MTGYAYGLYLLLGLCIAIVVTLAVRFLVGRVALMLDRLLTHPNRFWNVD